MADAAHRILVTGASGFIGKALVPALVARGHHVRAAARRAVFDTGVESVELPDITRPLDWAPLVEGIDVVIHLAAIAHRPAVEAIDHDQANRGATADLAEACKKAGVARLVFISSIGAQSGSASDGVLTEADDAVPEAHYGRAKLGGEQAIRAAGIDHTILRPTIVYGPNPIANVALLLRIARLPIPLPFGLFTNRRSLLAIDNLVSAIASSIDHPLMRNETFVVSDPEPVSLREMFSILRRADGSNPRLFPVPPSLLRMALRAVGRPHLWERFGTELIVDPRKLRDAGWQPAVTTQQGLTAMARGTPRS